MTAKVERAGAARAELLPATARGIAPPADRPQVEDGMKASPPSPHLPVRVAMTVRS